MANATTQPIDKVLKVIGGSYGEGETKEDSVGGIGGSKNGSLNRECHYKVALCFIENFRVREEVEISNCWYSREVS